MSQCLTDEEIEQLASGACPAGEGVPHQTHVEQCDSCRRILEECRENLRFADAVKAALSGPDSTLTVLQEHPGEVPGRTTPADQIEGYEILHELHRGAQGVVYRAVELATNRHVAVKFLREGAHASDATRKRFEREIELVVALQHPNIIRITESGVSAGGHHYYVMDYVDGLPLHRYVWENKLTLEETLKLFEIVCLAVNYAHQRGIMHRDLKPSNILVDALGEPRVLDFGLAKQVLDPAATLLSMSGQVVGTLPYMSPEQARGDHESVDIRTDVYALGVILYRILTAKYPYPVDGPIAEVLHHITETPPVPPSKVWTAKAGVTRRAQRWRGERRECPIDEEIETIILRALAKEPDRRYQNVAMLADDVSRYLQGQPIAAKRDAGLHLLRKSLARYKAAVAAVTLSTGFIAAFALISWGMYQNQRDLRERGDFERQRAINAQAQLADALTRLGDNALERGDVEDAFGHYKAALALNRHLTTARLDTPHHHVNLAETYLRLGDVARRRGEWTRASENYLMFNNIITELVRTLPSHRGYRDRLALSYERLADLAAESQDDVSARDYALQAKDARRALAEEPNARPAALDSYAWWLLTCPVTEVRSPAEALPLAIRAAELSHGQDADVIKTLALAYHLAEGREELGALRERAGTFLPRDPAALRELIASAQSDPRPALASRPAGRGEVQ